MKEESSPANIPDNSPLNPLLIVFSGPSGVGKDAVLDRLKELNYPAFFVTTLTTRPRRATEEDGREYRFVPREEFLEMIETGRLLEWAEVYGNLYGVPRDPVSRALKQGQDVIIKVDIQGAATIKKLVPQAITIFLIPPSMEELIKRLTGRSTESQSELDLRLKTAEEEMACLPQFDYAVINHAGKIDQAVSKIDSIIIAEKCRTARREIDI
jgi:guanylate kinase